MTSIDTARPAIDGGLMTRLFAIVSTLRSWHQARLTRNALLRLTDHELDDIGLCRGDIARIARDQLV